MGRCYFTVYDVLIRGLLDAGKYVKASQIIEELESKLPWRVYHKATALYKVSLMEYWFKQGKDEEAMEIYKVLDMSELMNTTVGNRVLQVLVEHGKNTEAWELFDEIVGLCNPETFGIMMKSFSKKRIPLWGASETCYRTIVACLCEQGKMSEAEEFFEEMFSDDKEEDESMVGPDVSTFRAMVNGYVMVGRVDDAINMLNKMKISNLRKLAIHRAT
ncbi:Tetratricopeptide repeat (TPR)-like superfamily protein [Raphanus sativus]|nr:Tetratricopeptide repeat (TPR)-like superfamily protein [Raphanus sativus]